MSTFEETVDKAIDVAVARAEAKINAKATEVISQLQSYADAKVNTAPKVISTSMVGMGYTKNQYVSVDAFLVKLKELGYKTGDVLQFPYADAVSAYVTDGSNNVRINAVTLVVGALGNVTSAAWQSSNAIVFGTGYAAKLTVLGAYTAATSSATKVVTNIA